MTNSKIILVLVCLLAVVLAGCAENQVIKDRRNEWVNAGDYGGAYAVGKSSHDNLYADHISAKENGMVAVHDRLFVDNNLYVNGRIFERDVHKKYVFKSLYKRILDGDNVAPSQSVTAICDPVFQKGIIGNALMGCDVYVDAQTNQGGHWQTSFGKVEYNEDGNGNVLGICPRNSDSSSLFGTGEVDNCYADGKWHNIATARVAVSGSDTACQVRYKGGVLHLYRDTKNIGSSSVNRGSCIMYVVYRYYEVKEPQIVVGQVVSVANVGNPPAPTGGGSWGSGP